jgi:hypothetical protein
LHREQTRQMVVEKENALQESEELYQGRVQNIRDQNTTLRLNAEKRSQAVLKAIEQELKIVTE